MKIYCITQTDWDSSQDILFVKKENRDKAFAEMTKNMVSEDGDFYHDPGSHSILLSKGETNTEDEKEEGE